MTLAYRTAVPGDGAAVSAIFTESFIDTFGHLYTEVNLDRFMAMVTPEAFEGEIARDDYAVRIAEEDGRPVGFVKLGPIGLPVEPARPAIEFRQLYVLPPWKGSGAGRALTDWAIGEARRRGAEQLFLSVYTDNHRARRFYDRLGFVEVGPYRFMVGDHADEDIIMRLDL